MSELHRCLLRAMLRERMGLTGRPIAKLVLIQGGKDKDADTESAPPKDSEATE